MQTGTVPGQGRYIMTTQSSSPDRANAHRTTRSLDMLSLSILLLVLVIPALVWGEEKGFSATSATNESEGSVNSQVELMALDQKNWQHPQSAFKWIAMARGFKVPWDTFGRQGWMTDDAYVDPVDPACPNFRRIRKYSISSSRYRPSMRPRNIERRGFTCRTDTPPQQNSREPMPCFWK